MTNLVVQPVVTRRERSEFLSFPWTLYRGDPYWIPPLRDTQKENVGYATNPFYDRNRIQPFLAYRDGQVCGRIAALINYGHIDRYHERLGFFGFFEAVDDQQVADALFDSARDWLAEQGIFTMRGPANPSLNYELGLLIEGFDSTPTFMMTYNPPYYERLYETYGLRKSQDLYAFWGHVSMLPKVAEKLAPLVQQIIERYNVRSARWTRKHFLDDVKMFLSIYNRSLTNTWGFVPMSNREMEHVAFGLQFLIVPELAIAAEIDGRMVGATFGLLDYNPRIRETDGRLFPFGFIHLLRNKQQIKRMRVISTNVLPEYQLLGIGMVLMHGLVPKAMEWGMEEAEFSWVLESNHLSRGALQKGGARSPRPTASMTTRPTPPPGRRAVTARLAAVAGRLDVRPVQTPQDLAAFLSVPWAYLRRRSAVGAPLLLDQKEFLDRENIHFTGTGWRHSLSPCATARAAGADPRQRRSALQPGAAEQRRLLRHVRVGRRPGDGPRLAGRRRRLAPRPRPHQGAWARSTTRPIIPAACWSTASTRRRG